MKFSKELLGITFRRLLHGDDLEVSDPKTNQDENCSIKYIVFCANSAGISSTRKKLVSGKVVCG
jgi:hypothetical protein